MIGTTLDDRLYNLLPAVYRVRDAAQGEPLRALLSLIQNVYDTLEQDITGLYENWFIETCAQWVVPYIGDLLEVRPLYAAGSDTFSARAYIANTLDLRRRKGTAAMLEELARDVTGWPAHVVEFFQLLATTQYLNHLRPANVFTPDLRDTNQLELLGGPFEQTAHTVDVRHISRGRGKYNIPNLGIFVWRLQDYLIGLHGASDARAVASPADGRYTFDPVGISTPLFNRPQTETGTIGPVREINVPAPLRRRPLYDELEALRQAEVDGAPTPVPVYFGADPVFQVLVNGTMVPFDQVMICDLGDISASDWRRPPATKAYTPSGGGAPVNKTIAVSVDPVRGRIAFPAGVTPSSVEVCYTYGFSGDVGADPYDRTDWLTDRARGPAPFNDSARWQVAVSKDVQAIANVVFPTLAAAVQAWNNQPAGKVGVIAVLDCHTYAEDLSGANGILVKEGSRLLIVAADWPAVRPLGVTQPKELSLSPRALRPHFLGSVSVSGIAPASSSNPGELFIDGLLLEGVLTIHSGNLAIFGLSHSTLTPGAGLSVLSSGAAGEDNARLAVNLYRSICGPINLNASIPALSITDSIVTSGPASAVTASAIAAPGAAASIQTTTVFGTTSALTIDASDSLFTGVVTATRRQKGCVRFCYVPVGSQTARRFHSQPDLALANLDPAAQSNVIARLTPQFTSIDFGQPGYAQISLRCASEISNGSDNGSEMGVFSFLQQPQRAANLLTALDEYLRFGLEAGMIQQT